MPPGEKIPPTSHAAQDDVEARLEQLRLENEQLLEAQAVLETACDTYFDAYDLASLALLTLDGSGSIRHLNRAAAELLQVDQKSVLERSFRVFVQASDQAKLSAQLSNCRVEEANRSELRLILRSGSTFLAEVKTRFSRRTVGAQIHVTLVDLSERERTELERQALVDAERRARLENDSKDQFIAMLSHELRTPLTPVLAAASTFRSDPNTSEDLRPVFEMIERNILAEARLIDDLLDATGIARQKMGIVTQPMDLHAVLEECASQAMLEAVRRGQDLLVVLDATAHFVLGDALRLRQVFTNLLRNALKFTPPGGTIWLRSWNRDSTLLVDVEDTGIGFEPADGARIFEPFDQRTKGIKPMGGLGLGLAIAKGLVSLHDGRIEAASRGPGRGARFVVELPTTSSSTYPVPPSSTRPPPRLTTRAKRILLVEDHQDTADMLGELLQGQGFEVTFAHSVESALAVDLSLVDLIVSDLGLPDGDGTDLIRVLQQPRHRPAIALSGFGMTADIRAATAAGFDAHLTKPVDFETLLATLLDLAGPSKPRASEARRGAP